MTTQTRNTPPHPLVPADCSTNRPRVDSEQILHGSRAVEIDHDGQRYLLRVTRDNKLILTK